MSSFETFHTIKSVVSETCLWIKDGTRYICVTYQYIPHTGQIMYAASVLKTEVLTDEHISNHEHTTTKRFEMRPVSTYFDQYLEYDDILKMIRREMCHGAGCVGIRKPISRSDSVPCDIISDTSVADDSELNQSCDIISDTSESDKFQVSPETHFVDHVYTFKYHILTRECHGDADMTLRIIYGCYKGTASNGHLIYGATIHHSPVYYPSNYDIPSLDDDAHYETALMRMEKCPVHMLIPEQYRHQLDEKAVHREDLMYEIVDKIYSKIKGWYQIRGTRY